MIELADLSPVIYPREAEPREAEYRRLLGYPPGYELSPRARELAAGARAWYKQHGRPWIFARQADSVSVAGDTIRIQETAFSSPRLSRSLREAEGHGAVLAAVSAGPELECEAQKLWREEKPDEYFFLEVLGSAVVEGLVTMVGARLCAWAEPRQLAVLPHYSPGYTEWDIAQQSNLLALIEPAFPPGFPGQIEALESGALRPRKSLLAVFGLTRQIDRIRPLSELVACRSCSFTPCQYRRKPYLGPVNTCSGPRPVEPNLPPHQVNLKALQQWAQNRLALKVQQDGSVDAAFRYDGTTCTNMGRPLAFEYRVRLGPRQEGYPILEQRCAPAVGDTGHTFMCGYLDRGEKLLAAIEQEKPLEGRPLHEVLSWIRPSCAAGCFCDADGRAHKWGLVLETIQYALANREGKEV